MTERPLIGISTYRQQAKYGDWDVLANLSPAAYADSVTAAGGVAVLLPPQSVGAAEAVARLDGLIIAGGADIEPDRYHAAPHPMTQFWQPERDAWEWALLDAADPVGLPVLGICRGLQLMVARAGGRLVQHVPEVVGHSDHSPNPGAYGKTAVHTEPGSKIRSLVGETVRVSCHHHQAAATHPGFAEAAHSPDGTVEALEDPDRAFWLAVQFHPEQGETPGLFAGLVAAAADFRVAERARIGVNGNSLGSNEESW